MIQTLSMRTKLLMAVLSLIASVALMGVTADAANASGVTEIRWVENHTPYNIYFWNHETRVRTEIAPYTAGSVNSRVPWATSERDYLRGQYIELGFLYPPSQPSWDVERMSIWQEDHNRQPYPGDKIRYDSACSQCGLIWSPWYRSDAKPMAGASNTGGRRNLIITYTPPPPGLFYVPMMHGRLCC